MAVCSSCSIGLPDGSQFCFSCGATQGGGACGSCGADLAVAGARFCSVCGAAQEVMTSAKASSAPAGPVASRRVTSVLFGDLVGFTSLSESRDSEEVRELLSRYFEECRRVVGRYGGTVEKFIGDAVMSVWGVPTSHEDDAERSVRAGLELVNAITSMGEELGVPELSMRVGIVTGEVAVTVGAEQQGMVAGDAVNTAARVQSAAAPGQVWVDETTRLLTSSAITYVDVGSHPMKGKTDPVPLWAVRAVVAAVGGAQRADGLEAPLVGRERELRLVKELFHSVEETSRPSLLVLVGEPGVGKSRLGWEFEKYIDGLSGTVRWHSGRCVAYGEGVAFYALAEAVRGRLISLQDIDGAEDADEDPARLVEDGLARYVPDQEERDWLRPRLEVLLGVGSAGSFPREDLFSAWTAFLERVGEDAHPVVLVIDDAQHADEGLLQFVEHLLTMSTFPCFVVLLTRPGLVENHPSLATNRGAHLSHLTPLGDVDIGRLLDGLVDGLPSDVAQRLVARSEGVPLFAVETVRSLIDRDLVVPRGGHYVLADPETLDLDEVGAPASLQALISARLDSLTAVQRQLVQRCSVLGAVFSQEQATRLSVEMDGVDPAQTVDLLAELVRLQVFSQASSRLSAEFGHYQFVQDVVRQVAYGTLSRRDRRATHIAVAAQLESEGDEAGDLAPIIAQHYLDAAEAMPSEPDVAELEASAIGHLERAAARARALGALSESAGHLMVALGRAHAAATKARLQSAAAWALVDAGELERGTALAGDAVRAFDALGDPIGAGIAAAAQGIALADLGDNAGALEVVEPRYQSLLEVSDADRPLLQLGRVLCSAELRARGQVTRRIREVLHRQIQIAEKIDDPAELAAALSALSLDYYFVGATKTAHLLMEGAADLARKHHLAEALARSLTNLTVEHVQRDLTKAVEIGREGTQAAERSGMAIWQANAGTNYSLALSAAGYWEEAVHTVERIPAVGAFDRILTSAVLGYIGIARGQPFDVPWSDGQAPVSDDTVERSWRHFCLALQAVSRGEHEQACVRSLEAAEEMNATTGLSDDLVHMWPLAAELAIRTSDHDAIDTLTSMVDDAAERMQVPLGIQAHRRRVAGLLARAEEPERTPTLLREAIEMFATWGARPYQARTEIELGQLLVELGDSGQGTALVGQGRAVLAELGAVGWLRELGVLEEIGAMDG